ncbi:hypothetical protein [Pseudomonas fluorescens]|uniref:hypothetical protein n=1 Tax=Pseudomonas fluorescens TaxID=294 RepID=UPI00123EF476|nr:hypothetical protein [Pseudomonas fluorescens]
MAGYHAKHACTGTAAATVTQTATVHVPNRYSSFAAKGIFLPGFHGKRPEKHGEWPVIVPFHWRQFLDELKIFNSSPYVH